MAIELDPLAGPNGGEKSRKLAAHWQDQINAIKDSPEMKQWLKRGTAIEARYRDDRNKTDDNSGRRRYNSLWANTEIMRPALYGRTPVPIAERKFHDKDPVGRAAATIIERALRNEIEICGFDDALQRSVSDYLLPGRGTAWVRYEPIIAEGVSLDPDPQDDMRDAEGPIEDADDEVEIDTTVTAKGRERAKLPTTPLSPEAGVEDAKEETQEKLDATGDRVVRESTPVDFLAWTDFFTFPARARVWKEVTAVGKKVYMSRDQMVKRFGKTVGQAIPLEKDDRSQRNMNTAALANDQDKGQVYEIWNKDDQTVYWVAMGYQHLLDRKDDPLELEGFFPVPRPLYANATNNTLVPVPDYIQYQDQAQQIDDLTQRIAMLTKACKMAGVYNAAAKDIQRLFNESVENELIPVDDWAAFAEKGGVEGNWSLMPVKEIIGIINELMVCKQKQIEEMDRLTGINDIMRGTSDARETLGGVRLKVNSTGTRLTSRQNEVARYARDIVRLMADVMSRHFSPQSLIEASGALYAEGLGPEDMPDLTALSAPPAPPAPPLPPNPMMGHNGGPPGPLPGQVMGGPPGPLPPPMGQPAPASPFPGGPNVVPFKGPNTPPAAPMQPPAMAPGGPQPAPGMLQQPAPPPDPMVAKMAALQRIIAAIQLLRNDRLRGFRIDIEVDSTIFPDQAQEKDDRTQFITSVTTYLQNAMTMGAAAPEAIPLLAKLLQFGVRGYRVGKDLESAIEEFGEQAVVMSKRLIAQRANQPNPEQIKAETEKNKGQVQLITAQTKADAEKTSAQAEITRQGLENQGEQANAQLDAQGKQADLEMKMIDKRIEETRLQIELIRLKNEQNKPPPVAAGAAG